MTDAPPKVFLSHASEDKERFVYRFATALRAKGVDVWVDRWEMLPGDKLIEKIFEEGLKNATAVIVVLSRFSVAKPWVREELDAAAVKRINSGSKLIPVVIEDCEVPEVLKTTIWERCNDLKDINSAVDRVAAAIFNKRTKPSIGKAPVYSDASCTSLPGLTAIDAYVLIEAAKYVVEHDESIVDPAKLFLQSEQPTISKDLLMDSIDILEQRGYVKVSRHLGEGPYGFRLTNSGLELYLSNHFSNYDALIPRLIALLVNEQVWASDEASVRLDVPHRVVKHIFERLEVRGHLGLSKTLSPVSRVFKVSPSLRRMLGR